MRFVWTAVAVLSGSLISRVSATKERGAAERMLFYAAYLAEEMLDDGLPFPPDFLVAPGCVGTRPGGRCNLDELMRHIYAPKIDSVPPFDLPDPTMVTATGVTDPLALKPNDPTKNFAALFEKIKGAKFKVAGKTVPVTGWTLNSNIRPDITSATPPGDYFDIISGMGDVISDARSKLGTGITAAQDNLLKFGKSSAQAVTEYRWFDGEPYRIKAFEAHPDLAGIDLKTKSVKFSSSNRRFPVIDMQATRDANPGLTPSIEDRLNAAQAAYTNAKPENAAHMKAINAGRDAAVKCGCTFDAVLDRLPVKRSQPGRNESNTVA